MVPACDPPAPAPSHVFFSGIALNRFHDYVLLYHIGPLEVLQPRLSVQVVITLKYGVHFPVRLECNSDCALKERNRRLALALEIKDPDQRSKLNHPPYTDFLKSYTK